jgi:hypothetical protein
MRIAYRSEAWCFIAPHSHRFPAPLFALHASYGRRSDTEEIS